MDEVFRISRGKPHDPEVDAWFTQRPDELGRLAKYWFDAMRGSGGDVLESIHDGCPVACIGDAPFGYVNVFSAHVNVGFFAGAFLPDPVHLLQGTGKRMRHVKVSPVIAYNREALMKLIAAAYRDMKQRINAAREA